MLWGIQNQLRFFISSDLGQQVSQHDVCGQASAFGQVGTDTALR
jgi:hypothetical protein